MPSALVRVVKRRTTWEQKDPDVVASAELSTSQGRLDHRPSVYLVEAATEDALQEHVVQVVAEHSVSLLSPPPTAIPPADLNRDRQELTTTPGRTAFRFANGSHRELALSSDSEVVELARLMVDEKTTRRLDYVTKAALLAHIRGKVADRDKEWESALAGKEKWARLAAKSTERRD